MAELKALVEDKDFLTGILPELKKKANASDVYTKTETYNKTEVDNFLSQQYVSVTATAQTTAVTDLLPTTGNAGTIYRVGNWDGTQYNDSVFSEYAWNGSAYIKLSTKSQVGEVYDISANHANSKYADLAAALNGGTNIPQSLQRGGMSIKYVQSSDNKYVQYRLMSDIFNTTPANWQGVDAEPTAGSDNLVKSGGVQNKVFNINTSPINISIGVDNTFINVIGNKGTSTGYAVSNTIILQAFNSITFTCAGYNGNVAVISIYDSTNDKYTPLIIATSNNVERYLYTNENEYPIEVRLSFRKAYGVKDAYITDNTVAIIAAKLNKDIKDLNESIDIHVENNVLGDLVFCDADDNIIMMLSDGHIQTKSFNSKKNIFSDEFAEKLKGIEDGAQVNNIKLRVDNTIESSDGVNPISIVKETAGLSAIIQDWGFIGDSLMSGIPNSNPVAVGDLIPMPNGRNFYKYSWGQMMCRLTGAFGTNYSRGGHTAKSWLSTYPNKQRNDGYNTDGTWNINFSTTHKVAYAISFGANDTTYFDTQYPGGIGTLENIHISSVDYTENDLNTFAGCYGKIISLCKEISPSSRIFVITTPPIEFSIPADIINIQREIANSSIFSHVYLVDLHKYMENSKIQNLYGDGHLYYQGYMYYAFCVMTYIDYIIRNNPVDFANIAFIEYLKEDTGQI